MKATRTMTPAEEAAWVKAAKKGMAAANHDEDITYDLENPALLRKARQQAGLRQADLASLIGIKHAYLSFLELGSKPLPHKYVARLDKVLGTGWRTYDP